jgi:hypothetical protein
MSRGLEQARAENARLRTRVTTITDEIVDMAKTIEDGLNLPRGLSLLGLASAAYLAGWRDAMTQENPPEATS